MSKKKKEKKDFNDEYYQRYLSLRSTPLANFLTQESLPGQLPITSINEDRLLKTAGLSRAVRDQIEGLQIGRLSVAVNVTGLTEEQLSTRAIMQLTSDPPQEVGRLQQLTSNWLLRPYPLGLRFSGKNMSPLPCWLCGAQYVALNMCEVDLPVQLHFALFHGSGGYVLKPAEMTSSLDARLSHRSAGAAADDDYWPPIRHALHRATVQLLSLHNLPKRSERRPRYEGSRGACHQFHPELSGTSAPPDDKKPSSPSVKLSLYPIGGAPPVTVPLCARRARAIALIMLSLQALLESGMRCPSLKRSRLRWRRTLSTTTG